MVVLITARVTNIMTIQTIGFMGLGAMGRRVVENFLKSGFSVRTYNRSQRAENDELYAQGAIACNNPCEVVEGADLVISMVRDDDASRYVWLDAEYGALAAMNESQVALELSTLSLDYTQELAERMSVSNIGFLDAPVSGSRPQAEAQKLIFFIGGDKAVFDQVLPALVHISGAVHHFGENGKGALFKLAVNAYFAGQISLVAELMQFLDKGGISAKEASDVLSSLPITSPALVLAIDAISKEQFAPMFPIELVEKDMSYVLRAFSSLGINANLSQAIHGAFSRAVEQGFGDDNINGVFQLS